MRRLCFQVLVAAALVAGAACDSNTDNTTPTTPTPTTTTETFEGTLNKNGAASHSFSVAVAGDVTVTATTIDPAATRALRDERRGR